MPKKIHGLLLPALIVLPAYSHANTAYITDSITVGIFKDSKLKGEPLERLPSGALVDVLQSTAEVAEVKSGSGKVGWMLTSFLSNNLPASIQLADVDQELNEAHAELDKARQKIEQLEETAEKANKDVGWMKAELEKARKKAETVEAQLKSKQGQAVEVEQQAETLDSQLADLKVKNADLEQRLAATLLINTAIEVDELKKQVPVVVRDEHGFSWTIVAAILALVVGFVAGYYWLDRRVRQRFCGVRIY